MIQCHMCGEYHDIDKSYFVSLVEFFTYYDAVLCYTCISQLEDIIAAGKMKFDYDFSDFVSPPSDTISDVDGVDSNTIRKALRMYSEIFRFPEMPRDVADRLAEILGGTPEFWITRERIYRENLESLRYNIANTETGFFWSAYREHLDHLASDETICPVCGGLTMWDVYEDDETSKDNDGVCIHMCINCGWWSLIW